MSFDVDKEEFYETFAELQDAEGSQRALEWAWSALDWAQQELRKEAAKSQSIVSGERAAVVAWLREEAEAAAQTFTLQAGEWANRIDDLANCIERGEHRPGGYPANNKKFAEKVQEQLRRDDKADQFRSNMSRFATSLRKDSSAQNLMDEHQMDNIQRGEHRREEKG